MIYPVPNKFGTQFWTLISLQNVHEEIFTDAHTNPPYEAPPHFFINPGETDTGQVLKALSSMSATRD